MSFLRTDIKYTLGKSPSLRDLSVCFFLSKDTNTEMPSVKEKTKVKLVFITRFCNWWTNAFEKAILIGIYWLPIDRNLTAAARPKCNGVLLQVIYPISPKIGDSISSQRIMPPRTQISYQVLDFWKFVLLLPLQNIEGNTETTWGYVNFGRDSREVLTSGREKWTPPFIIQERHHKKYP